MENRDADFETRVNVADGLPIRVVEMAGQARDRKRAGCGFDGRLGLARCAGADGVGDVDFVAAKFSQALDHIDDRRR